MADKPLPRDHKNWPEIISVFGRIGLLSFGGPAGQIGLMHKVLVDEKGWLGERQFLHALNFCMLLPGPEAMQLATYSGWMLKGVRGGLVAGSLFVLPGFAVLVMLSALYAFYGHVGVVSGMLLGLKAAVVVIVFQALRRVARKTLGHIYGYLVALLAFVALFIFSVPFPLVVGAAFVTGVLAPGLFKDNTDYRTGVPAISRGRSYFLAVVAGALIFWIVPVVGLMRWLPEQGAVLGELAWFFSKAAMVTFGGAYAVLAFVAQQAVTAYGWLTPEEMLTGLGLAETTPGPLILVLVFVGFLAGLREATGFDPLLAGILGAIVTTWVTFVPCFIWIFLGAPFMERLQQNRKLSSALSAITAAVVGVIANLSLWFALHVLFASVHSIDAGPARIQIPELATFDIRAGLIVALAGVLAAAGASLWWILGSAGLAGLALALIEQA